MQVGAKLWNSMVNLSPTGKIATSLILKDAVGCYLYVSQARRNKKMNPQQRADVANYDLANGIINIGLQLLAVKPIETVMKKFVDAKFMKHFFTNLDERLKDTNNKSVMKLLKHKAGLTEGAVALLSVIICQYFIKRGISPFFSVPVGDKSKEIGLIKPKLYPGETFERKNMNEVAQANNAEEDEDIYPNFTSQSASDLLHKYSHIQAATSPDPQDTFQKS